VLNPPLHQCVFRKMLKSVQIVSVIERMRHADGFGFDWIDRLPAASTRFIKMLSLFLFVVHLCACVRWSLVRSASLGGQESTWLPPVELMDAPWFQKYMNSLYWTVMAFVGEDLAPTSSAELAVTSFSVLVGLMLSSTLIGAMATMLQSLDVHSEKRRAQLDAIHEFLVDRRVDRSLRKKIYSYYDYLWQSGKNSYCNHLFDELPEGLSLQLTLNLKLELIAKSPFFSEASAPTIMAIIRRLESLIIQPYEIIVRQNEKGHSMFFLVNGFIAIWCWRNGKPQMIRTLHKGHHFGMSAILNHNEIRSANAQATTFCELEQLNKDDFQHLRETFSDIRIPASVRPDHELELDETSDIAEKKKQIINKDMSRHLSMKMSTHSSPLDSARNLSELSPNVIETLNKAVSRVKKKFMSANMPKDKMRDLMKAVEVTNTAVSRDNYENDIQLKRGETFQTKSERTSMSINTSRSILKGGTFSRHPSSQLEMRSREVYTYE